MIRNSLIRIRRNLLNAKGWRTRRKVIVFESDDWGSIRMPSRATYEKFRSRGFPMEQTQYNRYDALESNEDLQSLFEVLSKFKDKNQNPVCFTANMIVANPHFEAIALGGFQQYHYESVVETLARYPRHHLVFSLYKEGMAGGIFKPQLHGREHVQVNRWLTALRSNDSNLRFAFDCHTTYSGKDDYNFMESFDWDAHAEVEGQKEILQDGLRLFKEHFGYPSVSFIAPCYTWDPALEPVLVAEGVKYMQGAMNQYIPKGGFNNYKLRKHFMGQQSEELTYITRNCFFEPSLVPKGDWVSYTLDSIRDAFRWNKPAVICSHRINYIGFIDEANRTRNLKLLEELLRRITKIWPDVEFMSTDQLGKTITRDTAINV